MAENEKLECLKKLQEVLQKKFALENEVRDIPANLREEKKKLALASEQYLKLTEQYNTVNDEYKSLSIRYEDAFNQRTEYEKKVEFITTQREFDALGKQIQEASNLEISLLKSRNLKKEELKVLNEKLDKQQEICAAQQKVVDAEQDKITDILSEKNNEIDALNQKCNEIRGNIISDELYAKFCNISSKKDGLGIVPVYGQVCMGCNMVLPMQFVIDLRLKQEKDQLEYCPYCSRIIWYEKLDPEVEKDYIFEQLEPTKTEGGKVSSSVSSEGQSDSEGYDESMGGDFEDF